MELHASNHPDHTCHHVDLVDKTVDPEILARSATTFLLVQGIGCPVCAMRVHNCLLQVEGVLAVEVALASGLARIHYDAAQVTPEMLPEAVAGASHGERHHYSARILA